MIEELKRGRDLLHTVYPMDDLDKKALNEAKTIMAKASYEIIQLQDKLRKFERNKSYETNR